MTQSIEAGRRAGPVIVDPLQDTAAFVLHQLPELAELDTDWQWLHDTIPDRPGKLVVPEEVMLDAIDLVRYEAWRVDFPIHSIGAVSTRAIYDHGSFPLGVVGMMSRSAGPPPGRLGVSVNSDLNPDVFLTQKFEMTYSNRLTEPLPYSQNAPGTLHSSAELVKTMEQEHGWHWGGRMTLEADGIKRYHLLSPPLEWFQKWGEPIPGEG